MTVDTHVHMTTHVDFLPSDGFGKYVFKVVRVTMPKPLDLNYLSTSLYHKRHSPQGHWKHLRYSPKKLWKNKRGISNATNSTATLSSEQQVGN